LNHAPFNFIYYVPVVIKECAGWHSYILNKHSESILQAIPISLSVVYSIKIVQEEEN
jgi:hypothetical protein